MSCMEMAFTSSDPMPGITNTDPPSIPPMRRPISVMTGSSAAIRFASTGSTVEMICVSIGSTVARMLAIGGRIA